MIVLDTSYVSLLQYPEDARATSLRERLVASPDRDIVTTAITPEEQMRGWLSAIHGQRNVQRQVKYYERLVGLFRFFADWRILLFDDSAAKMFQSLRGQGLRVGTMDLKIAAIALVQDATLLTTNLRDFEKVPGLRVEDWL
ncbi:MAG TPA: type II toxin-antitoxin system VapC family toxin [Gemmataceae bacterium]|jgi:tRNA(fMet)-specific endonuclease VapC|nr:type II toxin-antitoxin system VapC family toxin [Gemmataceae bacterium]